MDTATRYLRLRHEHFGRSIHDLARRQQGAIVAVAAFLGPFTLATMIPVADAMARAVSADLAPAHRALVLAAWLLLTSLVVLALREPVFMARARPFLSTLPIDGAVHFHADLRSVATAYSLLWIPMALAVWRARAIQDAAALVTLFALGILMQSTFITATTRSAAAFAGAFALVVAATGSDGAVRFALLCAALGIAGFAALHAHGGRVAPLTRRSRSHFISRWAVRSGLALPILFGDTAHATWLRVAALIAITAAGAAMASLEGQCGKAWGFLLVQGALCAWALHRVPALVDERSRAALPAIFRIPRARLRAAGFAMVVGLGAFLAAMTIGYAAWHAQCRAPGAMRAAAASLVLAAALAAVALAAFRLSRSSAWVSAIAFALVAVVAGNLL